MKKSIKFTSYLMIILMIVCSLPVFSVISASAATKTVNEKIYGQVNYTNSWKVLDLVNKQRTKYGLSKLKMTTSLLNVANRRAAELSVYYAHQRPNGENNAFSMYKWKHHVSENIAINQTSAQEVVDAWMGSPSHRKNLLSSKFNSIGIGCFKVDGIYYWEQFFVDNKASANCKKPANKMTTYTIPTMAKYVNLVREEECVFTMSGNKKIKLVPYQLSQSIDDVDFLTPLRYTCVKFVSSDPTVATVDQYGTVTPIKKGGVVISCYVNGLSSKKLKWNIMVEK